MDLRSNGLVLRSHGYTINKYAQDFKKMNKTQPYDQNQRVERKRKENRVNQSGSGEPVGSPTPIKGNNGSGFVISSFLSLSKRNISGKKREKLSPLSS